MPEVSPSQSQSTLARLSQSAVGRATSRLTRRLASTTRVRSAGQFLRRQLWAWPILAALILGISGWLVSRSVERAMSRQREAELTTILNADVEALRIWMVEQGRNAELIAQDEQLVVSIKELIALAEKENDRSRALLQSPALAAVRSRVGPKLASQGYTGFFIVSPNGLELAADQDAPVGAVLTGYRAAFFDHVLKHGPSVSKPFRSPLLLKDETGAFRANLPTMFAAAPVKDANGKPIATFGIRIRPDLEFTQILRVAQMGQTGETYAFDDTGLMLSSSRFDDDLKRIGLLADLPDSDSVLTISLRNPGADMMAGQRPALRRQDQPLTFAAAEAIAGRNGCNPDEYRDYRGVPVVGAWTWLPEYDFGVITEMDKDEAYAPVYILRRAFWALMILLGVAAIAIFVAMLYMSRQQKQLQAAVLHAKQLGQYSLEEKLGAGGMGTVYRARHAMLRRPTAVKLLDIHNMSDEAIGRFEREVQATSTLTHPNTIQIFDYGRTPEGIFYYAMEFLDGMNLDDLVSRHGPISEARLIFILRQVCGSLSEAHATGLVHRDIKPANIVLTRRGGMHDFVKVLDFGLVKTVNGPEQSNLTSANAVTGTPLYLSPEAVTHADRIDARSDVYAIGAVAYWLLTGTPVFSGSSVVDICMKHVQEQPEPPSKRAGKAISPGLESLILQCLAKSTGDRPGDAAILLRLLEETPVTDSWNERAAAEWWAKLPTVSSPPPTQPSGSTSSARSKLPADANATMAYDANSTLDHAVPELAEERART